MKRSEARLYARIAAAIAAAITLVVIVVFLRRSYQEKEAQKGAPPPVPASVQRESQQFSFSKVEGTRTIFTVRASQATQMKGTNRSVLQDVWITIYGRKGDRNDVMHTQLCDYDNATGKVVCAGEVQLDLESADDAKLQAASVPSAAGASEPKIVHVATRGLEFQSGSGDATTEQDVEFRFPGGMGRANGVKYSSSDGVLELERSVEMKLNPPSGTAPAKGANVGASATQTSRVPVQVSAANLKYRREENAMLLRGPVIVKQAAQAGAKELRASEMAIRLDEKMAAREVTARGAAERPAEIVSDGPKGRTSVAAQEFGARLAPSGWVESFRAEGGVDATTKNGINSSQMRAGQMEGEMEPRVNQPKTVTVRGGVKIDSSARGEARHMESAAMRVDFAPVIKGRHQGAEAKRAETDSRTTVSWDEPAGSRANIGSGAASRTAATMQLTGERMEMEFGAQNKLKELKAHDGAELRRKEAGKPEAISSSRELAASFDARGEWSEVVQNGNFQLRNGDQAAQAEQARLTHTPEIVTLNGGSRINDKESETTANAITMNQTSGETQGEGNVVTTYLKRDADRGGAARGNVSGPQLGSEPAHVTADRLRASSGTGVALYTGHARMWQGDTTIEAEQIQLDQKARRIDAKQNVRALFVQTPKPDAPSMGRAAPQISSAGRAAGSGRGRGVAPEGPDLWHVKAGAFTYWDGESRAHAEGGVQADSTDSSMKSRTAEFYFEGDATPSGGKTQRLSRATGDGAVNIRVRDEHGTAEHAEYDATAAKLVLSGGNPTFFDSSGNKTTGRQLTVNLADDTIQIQSEEGSRTLPRHRVEK